MHSTQLIIHTTQLFAQQYDNTSVITSVCSSIHVIQYKAALAEHESHESHERVLNLQTESVTNRTFVDCLKSILDSI